MKEKMTLLDLRRHPLAASVVIVATLFASVLLFPRGMPLGLYMTGTIYGATTALAVVGVLLVYRSNRIINFAHVQMGAAGAVLFYELVAHRSLIRGAAAVCLGCLPKNPLLAPAWLQWTNFILALAAGLLVSLILGLALYLLVIRRFRNSPPLVPTVATLGVAAVLGYGTGQLPRIFGDKEGISGIARPPIDVTLRPFSGPFVLHIGEVLALVVVPLVLIGLALFLRKSKAGVAVRATAENADRAATLGMNATVTGAIVWMISGGIAGIGGILAVMTTGVTGVGAGSPQLLLRILSGAVLAGMTSFPMAVFSAIGIAVFDQGFLWSFGNGILVDAVLLIAIVIALLIRRARASGRIDPEATSWRAAQEVRPIPKELRALPVVHRWIRVGSAIVGLALLAFPWVMSPSDTSVGSVMLIFGIVGLSLLLLTGWAGQISLGQFAFAAVGGFVVAVLAGRFGWPILVSVPIAAIAGGLVAVLIGLPALRIRGLYLAVTTLGFAVVVTNVLLSERFGGALLPSTLDRPVLLGLDTNDERVFYYLTLLILAGCVTAVVGMRRSRTGRALIASRDNDRAAQAFGIGIVRARLEAFAVSGLLASLAGALYAYHQQGVHVGNYSPNASLTMFLMVVIGGLGSVAGPLLGALFVGGLTIFLGEGVTVATASLALLLLIFVPGGVSSVIYGARDGILRRVADRYRISVPSLAGARRAGDEDGHRISIAPKLLPTGATAFVPTRYRLGLHRPKVEISPARQDQ